MSVLIGGKNHKFKVAVTSSVIDITNLTHYYRLNDNSNDSIGTKNGTNTNVLFTPGLSGNSATFNGGSSKVVFPDDLFDTTVNNSVSVSLWIKQRVTGTSFERVLAFCRNGFNDPFVAITFDNTNDGVLARVFNPTNASNLEASSINQLGWNHFILTAEEFGTTSLYINGVEVDTSPMNDFVTISGLANTIGTTRNGSGFNFDGQIFGLGVWEEFITPTKALEIYNNQVGGQHLV